LHYISIHSIYIKINHRFKSQIINSKKSGTKAKTGGPFGNKVPTRGDNNYGANADPGDLSEHEYLHFINKLVKSLQLSPEKRKELERATVGQGMNEKWKTERRNRVTASNCGRIFTLQNFRTNTNILKSIIYPPDLSKNENIRNGINLEPEAKKLYSNLNPGVKVDDCGFFVYAKNGILGASPDAILGTDGILEIKCVNCPPTQIPLRADKFLERKIKNDSNSELQLRIKHKYYFQIIMQMYVSEKSYCDFFVFHKPSDKPTELEWFQQRISRTPETDALWKKIEEKLTNFYINEMAPEFVHPVFQCRGMFRIPDYRRDAMKEAEEKRQMKLAKAAEKADRLRTIVAEADIQVQISSSGVIELVE
jgi:putative phage-type endonuclease